MKNGYDHHDHQDIYTYNLSGLKRFTLDVPNQSPPYQGQFATLDDDQLQHDVDDQNDDQGDVFGDVMLTIIMNTGVCLSVKSVHIKIQL